MFKQKTVLLYLLASFMIVMARPIEPSAATARDKYFQAETCYKKLRNNSTKQKYRNNWLHCIEKFQAVYTHDSKGAWAAAGMYMSGELYWELYKRSYKMSDKQEALDIYERIVNRFPGSKYRAKAELAIRNLSKQKTPKTASKKIKLARGKDKPGTATDTARDQYVKAETCYNRLRKNPKRQKYRHNWFSCIDKFMAVYDDDPSGAWAAAGLYKTAELYQELYKHSFKTSDKKQAVAICKRITKDFPRSQYRHRAAEKIRVLSPKETGVEPSRKTGPEDTDEKAVLDSIAKEIEKLSSAQAEDKKAVKPPARPSEGGDATVQGLRFWSNPSYTRVVVDVDRETTYTHRLLKKDPSIRKPQRLYVDLYDARLGEESQKIVPINDNLLSDARAGQYTPDSVRVVIDIKSFKTYKIFDLKNPFRIVIDVWGKKAKPTRPAVTARKKDGKIQPGALAKQLALGVSRIVIDPGHGGRDFGAPGYLKGIHEKDITLKIGKRLAKRIREDLGCEVFMTRNSDRHLTLEERTAIANTKNADLFISIHTNAHKDRRAYGIETYILNFATDDEAILVAARENATSTKNISDLQTILSELMQHTKLDESGRLASHIQESMYKHMKRKYSRIRSKGVKQAPFYVLLGAQMPAILIESSFISNSRECKRLTSANYQEQLSISITNGIRKYIKETNPSAFFKTRTKSGSKG